MSGSILIIETEYMGGINIRIRCSKAAYQSAYWLVLQYAECSGGIDVRGDIIHRGDGDVDRDWIGQVSVGQYNSKAFWSVVVSIGGIR